MFSTQSIQKQHCVTILELLIRQTHYVKMFLPTLSAFKSCFHMYVSMFSILWRYQFSEILVICIHRTFCILSPFNILSYATATEVLPATCCLCYELNQPLVVMSYSTWMMTFENGKCLRSFTAVQNFCGFDRKVALHGHLVKAQALA